MVLPRAVAADNSSYLKTEGETLARLWQTSGDCGARLSDVGADHRRAEAWKSFTDF
jgi:hypothetical protein